jgi:hypothetical protein
VYNANAALPLETHMARVPASEFQRLRSLDRRAMHVSELTDEDLAALNAVKIPEEAARYNHEMT